MFCDHCAVQLPEGTRFCSNCGAPQPTSSAVAVAMPAPVRAAPMQALAMTRTSPLAIASLCLSIAGWFVLPLVGAIAGIALGHSARAQIRRDPNLDGSGLALIGLVLGYVQLSLMCLVLSVIAAIAGAAR